jgi:hypothetical protein
VKNGNEILYRYEMVLLLNAVMFRIESNEFLMILIVIGELFSLGKGVIPDRRPMEISSRLAHATHLYTGSELRKASKFTDPIKQRVRGDSTDEISSHH